MGKTWNQIQRPELIDRMRQFFGMRQAHLSPTLAAEIVPVVVIGNLDTLQQPLKTQGQAMNVLQASVTNKLAPIAGQFPKFLLRNPVGSGVVVKLRYVNAACVSAGTAAQSLLGYILAQNAVADLAGGGGQTGLNLLFTKRNPATNILLPRAVCSAGTAVGQTGAINWFSFDANFLNNSPLVQITIDAPLLVLDEGDEFIIQGQTVNTSLDINVIWDEEPKQT